MRSEQRRLAALHAAIKPPRSLVAKLEQLSGEQLAAYHRWREQLERWHETHPGLAAYEELLAGRPGPQLRCDVAEALFGAAPVITADMTEAQAAEVYSNYVREGKR